MKRILIFSTAYFPHVGGAEVAVAELTSRMHDIHFDMVTIRLSPSDSHFERVGSVNVYRVGLFRTRKKFLLKTNKFLFPFLGYAKARMLQHKHRYDAVWSIMASFGGAASLLFKFFFPNIPYLLTLQEGDSIVDIKKKVKWWMPLFRLIFSRADLIQVISNHLRLFALEMEPRKDVRVIPNGVDIEHFGGECDEKKISEIKGLFEKKGAGEKLEGGKELKSALIVTTSRLVKKNGIDTLIDTMRYLPPHVHLAIIGNGPDWEVLEERASGVASDRIHFVGFVPFKDISCYLKIADVFVRLSRSEGFGNSFIEAMAVGLPVVATNVGGIIDFVKDPNTVGMENATGLLVPPEKPQLAAKAITRILEDDKVRNYLKENGKKIAKEYDWNIIAPRMQAIFEELWKKKALKKL